MPIGFSEIQSCNLCVLQPRLALKNAWSQCVFAVTVDLCSPIAFCILNLKGCLERWNGHFMRSLLFSLQIEVKITSALAPLTFDNSKWVFGAHASFLTCSLHQFVTDSLINATRTWPTKKTWVV